MFRTTEVFQIAPHDKQDVELASRLYRSLAAQGTASLISPDGVKIELTPSFRRFLVRIAQELQESKALALVPLMQELSTKGAADLLGVSRPFVVRECEAKRLPFHFVGTHRRLLLKDVLAYNEQRQLLRQQSIIRMARQSEQLGDYDVFIEPDISSAAEPKKRRVTRKVDIREFLEETARFLASDTPVAVTRRGKTIGIFVPTEPGRPAPNEHP